MKFKIDDWVTTLSGETKQVTGLSEEQGSTIIYSDGFMCYASDCKLWEPKKGEWCWFYNKHTNIAPLLRKFEYKHNNHFYTNDETIFTKCEPLIGELPSFCKGVNDGNT